MRENLDICGMFLENHKFECAAPKKITYDFVRFKNCIKRR